jgi:hypothetical protein
MFLKRSLGQSKNRKAIYSSNSKRKKAFMMSHSTVMNIQILKKILKFHPANLTVLQVVVRKEAKKNRKTRQRIKVMKTMKETL